MDEAEIVTANARGCFDKFGSEIGSSVGGCPGDEVGAVDRIAGWVVNGCAGWEGSSVDWSRNVVVVHRDAG